MKAVTSTSDSTPPQYELFNDDLLMVELDDMGACFVDVRKSEQCDSDIATLATMTTRMACWQITCRLARKLWRRGRARLAIKT